MELDSVVILGTELRRERSKRNVEDESGEGQISMLCVDMALRWHSVDEIGTNIN